MADEPKPKRSLAEYMPLLADEFVRTCKANGIELDYLPRTLPYVQRILDQTKVELRNLVFKKDPLAAKYHHQYTMWMSAYLGEVIRRETKGNWFVHTDTPMLNTGTDLFTVPLTAVESWMTGVPLEGEGGVRLETPKAYCEAICRAQRQWFDRLLLGHYESMAALRTSMTPDAKLAGLLVQLAQSTLLAAKLDWGESLDCSPGSLSAVERILGAMHDYISKPGNEESRTDESTATVAKMFGAYVGEVVRRTYGGQWALATDGVLELRIGDATIYPVGKVRKRLVDGPGDNIPFYFNAMSKMIPS